MNSWVIFWIDRANAKWWREDAGQHLTVQLACAAFLERMPWLNCSDIACVIDADMLEEMGEAGLRSVDITALQGPPPRS